MIYILEDDNSIRELVTYTLNRSGYEAKGFDLPSLFWAEMEKQMPDLLLLDIMLPEEDGIHILKRLRANSTTSQLPVIMLTAKGSEYDRVTGLDSGADDYIPKPFGMMELVARVNALLRRAKPRNAPDEYQVGEIQLFPARHQVLVNKEEISLTHKEFELLSVLIQQPGIVFTREKLLNQIWGYTFEAESRTVDVHIRTLRQKLGECGSYIETVRGTGYRIRENGV
ncbi:MAG: response regulator transcription factor [Fournierella sp.]|uniref:response regulator transcription factor n=1 Tax=Allofournierella sp. TaxID=1940256 RepID=UPI002A83503E|nr:response regulator transcription factor [Fournierella sp.]MDY4167733.1 response regulator transcription factor [Fournierella sp.]